MAQTSGIGVILNVQFEEVEKQIAAYRKLLNSLDRVQKGPPMENPASRKYTEAMARFYSGTRSFSSAMGSPAFNKYISIATDVFSLLTQLKEKIDIVHKKRADNQKNENIKRGQLTKTTALLAILFLALKVEKKKETEVFRKQHPVFNAFKKNYKDIKKSFSYYNILEIVPTVTANLWLLGFPILLGIANLAVLAGLGMLVFTAIVLVTQWNSIAGWMTSTYGTIAKTFTTWIGAWSGTNVDLTNTAQATTVSAATDAVTSQVQRGLAGWSIFDAIKGYLTGYKPASSDLKTAKINTLEANKIATVGNIQTLHDTYSSNNRNVISSYRQTSNALTHNALSGTVSNQNISNDTATTLNTIAQQKISVESLVTDPDPMTQLINQMYGPLNWITDKLRSSYDQYKEWAATVFDPSARVVYGMTHPVHTQRGGVIANIATTSTFTTRSSTYQSQYINPFTSTSTYHVTAITPSTMADHKAKLAKKISEYYTTQLYRRRTTQLR